jgi:hypothetical protein
MSASLRSAGCTRTRSADAQEEMALAPADLLGPIVAMRPPFSVVFTVWASMIATDGCGWRSIWVRTRSRSRSWIRSHVPSPAARPDSTDGLSAHGAGHAASSARHSRRAAHTGCHCTPRGSATCRVGPRAFLEVTAVPGSATPHRSGRWYRPGAGLT